MKKIANFFSSGIFPTLGFFLFTLGLANLPEGQQKIPSSLFNIEKISFDVQSFSFLIPVFVGVVLILDIVGQYYTFKDSFNKINLSSEDIKCNINQNIQKTTTVFWIILYFNLAVLLIKYYDVNNKFSAHYSIFLFWVVALYLTTSLISFLTLKEWDQKTKDMIEKKPPINIKDFLKQIDEIKMNDIIEKIKKIKANNSIMEIDEIRMFDALKMNDIVEKIDALKMNDVRKMINKTYCLYEKY